MNLTWIDWSIVVVLISFLVVVVRLSRTLVQSVADFLSAGRTAGRFYMITVSQGMSMLGSITIVGMWEMNYVAGFSLRWWEFTMGVVLVAITVSGWVIYRFRQTRALTMAQFFEIRYSRRFRIFAGILAFLSGIVNFGIFPAVGARFFIYFCGLPLSFPVFGLNVATFPVVMLIFLGIALYFVFAGGQIAVMITEFIQGIFVNVVFVGIVILFALTIDWTRMFEALSSAPRDASLLNPYHTGNVKDFNLGYFLIGVAGVIYGKMSWQGTQGYNSSAKSAHEAKMGEVLGNLRDIPKWLMLVFVPIVAYTVMHHPDFLTQSGAVTAVLHSIDSNAIKSQLTVPLVLTHLLPVGLMGALTAVMLMATIGTHDSYLHSWGSTFHPGCCYAVPEQTDERRATPASAAAVHLRCLCVHFLLQFDLPAKRIHLPLLRNHRCHFYRGFGCGDYRRAVLETGHNCSGLERFDHRVGYRGGRDYSPSGHPRLYH